jgi:hypothetical protein
MSDEPENLGAEAAEPEEGFMKPTRRRLKLRCLRCGEVYYSKPFVVMPKKDPPCTRRQCVIDREVEERLAKDERFQKMMAEERAPGHVGANNQVKAIDATADIVMRDYGLTDLKSSIREGESMAPKLPPHQQSRADAMFAGPQRASAGRTAFAKRAGMLANQALLGGGVAFKGRGPRIDRIQAAAAKPGDSPFTIRSDPAHPNMVVMRPK